MPARTGLTMGDVWTGTLCAPNQTEGLTNQNYTLSPPLNSVGIVAIGCGASIVNSGPGGSLPHMVYTYSPTVGWHIWLYAPFLVSVAAGMYSTDQVQVFLNYVEFTQPPAAPSPVGVWPALPSGAIVVSTLEVPVTISVAGIFACTEVTDSNPTDRMSPKDYTDRTFGTSWYADEDTSRTVTAVVPGYGTLTATKTGLGYAAGAIDVEPHEIGGNFSAAWSVGLNRAPVTNTVYASIESPACGGGDVNLGYLNLHNPGTGEQPPDAVTAGWYFSPPASGAYWHIFNSSGIAIERKTAATTSGVSWTGYTSLPYLTSVVFNDGAFSDETSLSVDYDCGAIEYVDGDAVVHYFTGDEDWDEFHSDWDPPGWRKWGSRTFQAMEKNAWRATYGENVGGSVSNENDARAGLKVPPIDATSWNIAALGSLVWPMMSVGLDASIDINDPEDAPSRPSDWAAVSGCTVSGDTWTVAASASSPKVKRVLATRYWLRLNNLQGYSDDPELPRDFNWPIMMRPNINLTNGEDGTDIETAVPYEDEWHWNQYAYLLLGLTAAKTGTITLQVKYSTVSVSDPCYPSVEFRAGEWEYTRNTHTATYNIDVSAGANSIQVDLCCPTEGGIPELWHVDEVWFTLPDGGEAAEEYTLKGLELTKDTVNSNTLRFRAVRCWQWANNLGFGIGAIHDGKHVLTIGDAYGYTAHRNEKCLSYIQYAQNNPESTSEVDPSTAKSLARMCNEIGWLRGWNVTYDIDDSDPNVKNEDEDGNVQSSAFYSWDLWEAHENSLEQQYGATTVGYWQLLAGTRNTIHVEKFPRGRIQGIAKTTDGTARAANETGEVYITGIKAGSQILSEAVNTDAHGWFRSSPIKELDCSYTVGSIGGLTAVNREYTDAIATIPSGVDFIRLDGRYGDIIWRIYESGGTVFADRWEAAGAYSWASFGKPFTATDAYPDIALQLDGGVLACATVSGDTQFKILRNLDGEWEAVSTATIGDGLINGGICHDNGMTWFAGCADIAGDGTVYASGSSSADLVAEELNVAAETSLEVCTYTGGTPVCDIHVCPETRHLIVTVADATGSKFYRCSNLDDGFSQVT